MTAFATSAGNALDRPDPEESFGEFIFAGDVPIGRIASFYGFPVRKAEMATAVAEFAATSCAADRPWVTWLNWKRSSSSFRRSRTTRSPE